MFAGSRYCARCGAESAREVLEEESPSCPGCREEMRAVRVGASTFRECPGCGGVWMHGDAFERMCADREQQAGIRSYVFSLTRPDGTGRSAAVRYIPCPRCNRIMNRLNFARRSGVILDVCKAHGVWLDHGELGRLVAFIDAGGLAVARERGREQERLEEQLRRTRALEPTPLQANASRRARTVFERRAFENLASLGRAERGAGFLGWLVRDLVFDFVFWCGRVFFWFLRER
jgi:Zn-finger nucleic acid-binding protein